MAKGISRSLAAGPALLLLLALCVSSRAASSIYVHTSGTQILDGAGQPLILRGVNLGSWLWPEYYMMGSPNLGGQYGNAGTGSGGIANYYDGFAAAIQDLMGGDTNLTSQVLNAYWSNYITCADVIYLHTNGFNSVRVPFDFEEFYQVTNWANNYPTNGFDIDTGFNYFDNLLSWCAANGIYVIPDMHCAPGGPNNYSVTNYGGTLNTNTASVFANPSNLALAGHIWNRIAARYATNTSIGGYDLLNEPVNTSVAGGQVGSPLVANTYSNLVRAIRSVDSNHMLLCEGDFYASTLWDVNNTGWSDPASNVCFSDHDYGSPLPLGTGNRSTCVAANVPIWGGEFGINSTRWYNRIIGTTYENPVTLTSGGRTATILEGHCFWAYKSTQFYTVVQNPQTPGWKTLLAYWNSGNTLPKPSVSNAYSWLISYAQAANFSNCVAHPEIVDALMRKGTNSLNNGFGQAGLPYRSGVTIPGKIFAVDYDMGDSNITYSDTVSEDTANRGPSGTAWNNGYFGRDDGVDTTGCSDPGTLLKIGWNDAGEWQRHSVTCTLGLYNLYLRYAGGASGGQIRLSLLTLNSTNSTIVLGSNDMTGVLTLPTTGSYTAYSTLMVPNISVTNSGPATLQVDIVAPGFDFVWAELAPANGPPLPPTGESVIGAQTGVPIGLSAGVSAIAGNATVSLNWVPANGATSYNIKRALVSGGAYTLVGSSTATSFVDSGLNNGATYFYVVTAVNSSGEGGISAEVNATPQNSSFPAPWMDQDVGVSTQWSGDAGDVGWPGSASYSSGVFTLSGSGLDIWDYADSCHYAYRAVAGDCTNTVRVNGLQNTDPWAKAGLMIRESLNQDSANVFVCVTSQNGVLFSYRPAAGTPSSSFSQSGAAAPYWVRLVRQGNTFTAYSSSNGATWTQVGSPTTVAMATNVFAGMAVTAHNNTRLNTASFAFMSLVSQLPAAPAGLSANPGLTQVALQWAPSSGAQSYTVMRSTVSGGPYQAIANTVLGTNFVDSAITNGTGYYYVVTAVNPNGQSAFSSEAFASVPLPGLSASWPGSGLLLTWPLSASTFKVYSASNLAPPVAWTLVTNAIVNQGGTSSMMVPPGQGNQLFRLSTQ